MVQLVRSTVHVRVDSTSVMRLFTQPVVGTSILKSRGVRVRSSHICQTKASLNTWTSKLGCNVDLVIKKQRTVKDSASLSCSA